MDTPDMSADEAAELLGVKRATLYSYVSRKGVRSLRVTGSRETRYWRADIQRLKDGATRLPPVVGGARRESEITLIAEEGPYYRGRSAIELAETESIESVAGLLWQVDAEELSATPAPQGAKVYLELDRLLKLQYLVDRPLALFPFLEAANPRAFDLSHRGMATTGVDMMRWLSAIILNLEEPSSEAIHIQFQRALKLTPELTDLVRRLLVISADNGLNAAAYAVRAVTSTGVTPWRAVATGMAVATGRASKFGKSEGIYNFVREVIAGDPEEVVVRQLRQMRDWEDPPGFGSTNYPKGDPRARALLAYCEQALSDDPEYRRLRRALAMLRDARQLEPNFDLANAFIYSRLGLQVRRGLRGLNSGESPYLIGRTAGWVAHCIEQYRGGEIRLRELLYRGILPPIRPSHVDE